MAKSAVTELMQQRVDVPDKPEAVQDSLPPSPEALDIVVADELEMRGLRIGIA